MPKLAPALIGLVAGPALAPVRTAILKSTGPEKSGSHTLIPSDLKDDYTPQKALALLRGSRTNAAFSPSQKQAVR